jgi:hypothetical protein
VTEPHLRLRPKDPDPVQRKQIISGLRGLPGRRGRLTESTGLSARLRHTLVGMEVPVLRASKVEAAVNRGSWIRVRNQPSPRVAKGRDQDQVRREAIVRRRKAVEVEAEGGAEVEGEEVEEGETNTISISISNTFYLNTRKIS